MRRSVALVHTVPCRFLVAAAHKFIHCHVLLGHCRLFFVGQVWIDGVIVLKILIERLKFFWDFIGAHPFNLSLIFVHEFVHHKLLVDIKWLWHCKLRQLIVLLIVNWATMHY